MSPTEKAAALIRPAVVELEVRAAGRVRLPNGDLLVSGPAGPFEVTWHCSGFVVNPDGWVATAGHCADPDTARPDIISAATMVDVGEAIVAVGFPHSTDSVVDSPADPTSKTGTVSRKATRKGVPEYEIDAAVSPGMSGGPVANLDGKVIGSVSFSPTLELQPFNFVAPADGLAVLMAAKGVTAALGPADIAYRRGLNEYYAGRYTDAIGDFDKTLLMSPGYAGAATFRTDAANLRQQYGDVPTSFGGPLMWYAIGGFALLLGLGGASSIARRRRHRLPPAAAIDMEDWEPGHLITLLPTTHRNCRRC